MNENKPIISSSVLINYAHGLLPADRAVQVKYALEQDEMLRWEYEGILELMKNHPDKDPEQLLDEMVEKAEKKNKGPKVIPFWKRMAAAAIIVLAIGTGFYYLWNGQHDPVKFARSVTDERYDVPYSRGINADTALMWVEHFKEGDYKAVIRDLQPRNSLTHADQFYLGLSYLKSSPMQAAKAEEMLQRAVSSGVAYQSDGWLYLGIAQIMQKKNDEAIKSLSRSEHSHAKALLDLLRK